MFSFRVPGEVTSYRAMINEKYFRSCHKYFGKNFYIKIKFINIQTIPGNLAGLDEKKTLILFECQ